jgi:acetoacetate decarboxylase
MPIPMDQIANMPAFSPYYSMPPARYRRAKFQFVFFQADLAAIDRVLPACFEPVDGGLCAAIGISIPWSSNYGAFEECALTIPCSYEGQVGYFTPVAFLNSRSSIPAGREIYGTPKVAADIKVGMDERVMFTDTCLAGASVLSIRSTMHREATIEDLPVLQPAWRLKVIPRADGPGTEVMQLIDVSDVTTDVTVHVCRAGDGVIECRPSPIYDLSDFTPRTYLGAYYLEMDYTEGYARIVKDFLKT